MESTRSSSPGLVGHDRRARTGILLVFAGLLILGVVMYRRIQPQGVRAEDTVRLHYRLLLDDQTVYFVTEAEKPVVYRLGEGRLLPGLEQALIGMQAGEKKTVRLTPEQAYGPHRTELVMAINRSELPDGTQPEVGQQLLMESESGSPLAMVVLEMTEAIIILDANHPLSGHNLTFEIELIEILGRQTPNRSSY